MPDWSYHTMFKPFLFILNPKTARNLTLKAMNLVSNMPLGSKVIELLGHMSPSEAVSKTLSDVYYQSPVGLSGQLDVNQNGTFPLSKLGLGFIEIGPITHKPIKENNIDKSVKQKRIIYDSPYSNIGLDLTLSNLQKNKNRLKTPLHIRITHEPSKNKEDAIEEMKILIQSLNGYADVFVVQTTHLLNQNDWEELIKESRAPFFLFAAHEDIFIPNNVKGIVLPDGYYNGNKYFVDTTVKVKSMELIKKFKETNENLTIVATGIYEPQDAIDLLDAGADLVTLHSGFVFSGPGLPKRINELISSQSNDLNEGYKEEELGWIAFALMAVGIFIGGSLATLVALTVVLLPYDEQFLGMTKEHLHTINDRIIPFMSHDRISLAGVMLSTAIIYWQLAIHGIRRRIHWTKITYLAGAITGFLNFFLFIGFGYFDILHAFFYLLLLPFFIFGLFYSKQSTLSDISLNRYNSKAWKMSLYGQTIFVFLALLLIVGGIIIVYIGINDVFVKEDLSYIGLQIEEIALIADKLIPLIAHDRTGFGAALFSNGLLLLLLSLWGIREGERWIWWTIFLGGIPGFLYGFGAHLLIGYIDLHHLMPAFLLIVLYILGLILTYPFLTKRNFELKEKVG